MTSAGTTPDDEVAMLLVRCGQADADAFHRLYEVQSSHLYGVAPRIIQQPSLASDAVHDALLQVWRNAARYDPAGGSARGWLLTLVRYRALDSISHVGREVPGDAMPELADPDLGPLDRFLVTEAGSALTRCLAALEPDRRHLVSLAFLHGLSHSEIAARAALPLGSVKSSIRRALLTLRICLDGTQA